MGPVSPQTMGVAAIARSSGEQDPSRACIMGDPNRKLRASTNRSHFATPTWRQSGGRLAEGWRPPLGCTDLLDEDQADLDGYRSSGPPPIRGEPRFPLAPLTNEVVAQLLATREWVAGISLLTSATTAEWRAWHLSDPNAWSKESFRFMRFGLAATLLHDGYYSSADGDGLKGGLSQNGHSWVRYHGHAEVGGRRTVPVAHAVTAAPRSPVSSHASQRRCEK